MQTEILQRQYLAVSYTHLFEALPEDEKYSGTDSVEELLNKMKKGEQLSVSEMAYVDVYKRQVIQ